MKAIVAEIDKKQMIVITDKGDFIKVKRQMPVGIGDEIELKPRKANQIYRRLTTVAACLLACIFLSTGVYAYYTPYSYVSVDINPSITLSLNRFERVISVNPLNEDGASLLEDVKSLKNQDIDSAVSTIIKSATEKGYIDAESENQVMVVVSTRDQKQEKELTESVATTAAEELAKVNQDSEVMIEKTTVENYKEAVSKKVSPGKEILADKLREVMPEIKDEEVVNMSVKDVVHLINEGRKAEKAAEKEKDKEQGKNKEEQKDKEAAKAEPEDKKDNKGGNPKTPAAARKNNNGNNDAKDKEKPAAVKKDNDDKGKPAAINNDKDEKSKAPAAVENDKQDEEKDTHKEDEDKKKDTNENIGKPQDGPGGIGDNNGGNGGDKADEKDRDGQDKGGEKGDKGKDK